MRVSNAFTSRFGLAGPLVLGCLLLGFRASAQEPTPGPVEPAVEGAEPAPEIGAPVVDAPEPVMAADAHLEADLAALKTELADTRAQLEEVKTRQDDAEDAAIADAPKEDLLRIYGFADTGVQRQWVDKGSLLARLFPTNATSFVIGNLNLYFDAQPVEHWRSLIEVRFTNAPLGDTASYGGIAGTYARRDTFSYDPHGTAVNAPMWAGAIVLERAWIEWNEYQPFKLRVGNWFTPFGIWNADHGSPTLIGLALPQFILQLWMPVRQTGLMAHGNTFEGEWELGYALTFSNGRQELSNFNFEGKFGYGGRLYARRDPGTVNTTFGLSYFTGTTSDQAINVTSLTPITFETQKTWEYNEHVVGADVAIDIDATRIRAEAILRRVTYTPGRRPPGNPVIVPGSFSLDSYQQSAYVLVANQLPWGGLEPFLWAEVQSSPTPIGDGVFVGSVGLNVHFNAAITLKTQLTRAVFFEWMYDSAADPSLNDLSAAYSRIVMAF